MGGLLRTAGKIALWITVLGFAGAIVLVGVDHHHSDRVGGFARIAELRKEPIAGSLGQAPSWKALGAHIVGIAIALIVCALCLLPIGWYYFLLGVAPFIVKSGIAAVVLIQNSASWVIHAPFEFCSHLLYLIWGFVNQAVIQRTLRTTITVASTIGPPLLVVVPGVTIITILLCIMMPRRSPPLK